MYDTTKPYTSRITELIRRTWDTPYVSVDMSSHPVFTERKSILNYPKVDHVDGIGTKGVYHWKQRTLGYAIDDALRQNLNDLATVRAIPYKLQDHILIEKDDHAAILEIVEALSDECVRRSIAITGGETAIHDNMEGLDISISVSGFVRDKKQNRPQAGDTLVGFRSAGLHASGFTRVREIFGDEYREEFTEPTKMYMDEIARLDGMFDIHAMWHLTGGAYTRLRIPYRDVFIVNHDLRPHEVFYELYKRGMPRSQITDKQMYKTFNCGVGFVVAVSSEDAKKLASESRIDAVPIGHIMHGDGNVRIHSKFGKKTIVL